MKFLAPLVLTLAGIGAGVGAGVALRAGPEAAETDSQQNGAPHEAAAGQDRKEGRAAATNDKAGSGGHGGGRGGEGSSEFVELRHQFIVPVLEQARVQSVVVLSLDLEVAPAKSETVIRHEPKIRDAFLTVLFDHANTGGFEGNFTSNKSMDMLRGALREAGQKAVGADALTDVLITNIIRQEV